MRFLRSFHQFSLKVLFHNLCTSDSFWATGETNFVDSWHPLGAFHKTSNTLLSNSTQVVFNYMYIWSMFRLTYICVILKIFITLWHQKYVPLNITLNWKNKIMYFVHNGARFIGDLQLNKKNLFHPINNF